MPSVILPDPSADLVVLDAPVRAIEQDDRGVAVISDAGVWEARYVIVTVPVPLSGRIR